MENKTCKCNCCCCHDYEKYPCGCKKCKKCGYILRNCPSWTYNVPYNEIYTTGTPTWTIDTTTTTGNHIPDGTTINIIN